MAQVNHSDAQTPSGARIGECVRLLKSKGIRTTRQRMSVLSLLLASDTPLTAEDLYVQVRESCPNVSLSTVYRVLDALCEKNVLTKSGLMEGGRAMFEVTPLTHRHNLICIRCHRITPLRDCPLEDYETDVEKTTGYTVSGHKLEIYGICPKCKGKRPSSDSL